MPEHLTDMERRVYRALAESEDARGLAPSTLARLAEIAVNEMSTGEGVKRRRTVSAIPSPYPRMDDRDLDRLRKYSRYVEASFAAMPDGWRSWDEMSCCEQERALERECPSAGSKDA